MQIKELQTENLVLMENEVWPLRRIGKTMSTFLPIICHPNRVTSLSKSYVTAVTSRRETGIGGIAMQVGFSF